MQKYSVKSVEEEEGLQYPAKTTQACPQNYTRVKLSTQAEVVIALDLPAKQNFLPLPNPGLLQSW